MQITEFQNEEMYCLFAPDGSWQGMTLSENFETCIAVIKMLHKAGLSKSYHELSMKGFRVMPIKVSIIQSGDENKPFSKNDNSSSNR